MSLMMDYICEQPKVLRSILRHAGEITGPFVEAFRDRSVRNVLAIGTGSSWNSASAVPLLYGKWLHASFQPLPPTRCLPLAGCCDPEDTVVIFCSQSGTSTSTNAYVDLLKKKGFPTVSVCQDPKAYLPAHTDIQIALEVGEEDWGPKTKGVTGTILTLSMMALELGRAKGFVSDEETEKILRTYERSFDVMQELSP